MNSTQKESVDKHRSQIIKVLSIYSGTAIRWLRNEDYLTREAEDLVLSEKTHLAQAMRILDLLVHADNGWLGLTEYLQQHSNGELARTLHPELASKPSNIYNHVDNSVVFKQAELAHCVPLAIKSATPDWLTILQDKLRSFYTASFAQIRLFPNDHASAVRIEKIWVNLNLAAYKEEEAHEDYLKALSVAFESDLPIIIKGEPGIGKTTLALKICYDWAGGKLPQFDLVICGKMRGITKADTLLDIALEWTKSRCPTINFDGLKINLGNSNLNLLVILDGYDEFIGHCNEVERLLKCVEPFDLAFTLIITTRSYKLYEITCPHYLLTVRGFSRSQQLQFVENFSQLQKKEAILVQKKIQSTANLSSLCRIPLFIYFICCLSECESLDGSVTKLLYLLCESLISRYRTLTQPSAELTNWRTSNWFANLGALALHGLRDFDQGKLCFDNTDLERFSMAIHNVAYSIGFLNKEEIVAPIGSSRKVSVSFPHTIFQEYFAALALSDNTSALRGLVPTEKTPLGEFFAMLANDTHKRLEMQQVLIFLAGMKDGQANLFSFLRSNSSKITGLLEDDLALLQRVQIECKDQQQVEDLVRAKLAQYSPHHMLAGFDLQLFVHLYNAYCRSPYSPAIPCGRQGVSQLLFFNHHLTSCLSHFFNTSARNTTVNNLRDNNLKLTEAWFAGTEQHLPEFAQILQMSQLPLKFLRITIELGGMDTSIIWPTMHTLKAVGIDSTGCGGTGLVPGTVQSLLEIQPAIDCLAFCAKNQLVTSLDTHCWPKTITKLVFYNVNFDTSLASQLREAIEKLPIKSLEIHKSSINLEAFDNLCHTLSMEGRLQLLILGSVRMDGLQCPEGCSAFSRCYKGLTVLKELFIVDCGISDSVAERLLDSFQAMKNLKKVRLAWNPISTTMKTRLQQCLEQLNVLNVRL